MPKTRQDITALAYDKRGRLLSIGRNSYTKTHPLQAKFAKHTPDPKRVYLHAELDALIKARGPVHRLVVVRAGAGGQRMNAKPCAACQLAIAAFGVKKLEHT